MRGVDEGVIKTNVTTLDVSRILRSPHNHNLNFKIKLVSKFRSEFGPVQVQ